MFSTATHSITNDPTEQLHQFLRFLLFHPMFLLVAGHVPRRLQRHTHRHLVKQAIRHLKERGVNAIEL